MIKKAEHTVKKLKWRVRVVMAEKGVRSVSELMRKLETVGLKISIAQLGRLIDGKSDHVNMMIIEGMMTVLDCSLNDLLREHL